MTDTNHSDDLTEDPLQELVDHNEISIPEQLAPPDEEVASSRSGKGMVGVVLTAVVIGLFLWMIQPDKPNAQPIDKTGEYPAIEPRERLKPASLPEPREK